MSSECRETHDTDKTSLFVFLLPLQFFLITASSSPSVTKRNAQNQGRVNLVYSARDAKEKTREREREKEKEKESLGYENVWNNEPTR